MGERPHGYAKYKAEGCRCYTCAWAVSQYNIRRERAIAAGTWQPRIDAEPARAHVLQLMAAGLGRRRIAALSGISATSIEALLQGKSGRPPTRRIAHETAARLLSVTGDRATPADGTPVASTGTHRRIQALACLGWTLTEQARRYGLSVGSYAVLLDRQQVLKSTADRVRMLYETLSMTVAPAGYGATRVRNIAREHGWFGPLAWDDDTIDDPSAVPQILPPVGPVPPGVDELAIQHLAAGHRPWDALDTNTRAEAVRRMCASGTSQSEVARELGVSRSYVGQLVQRAEALAGAATPTESPSTKECQPA